MEHITDQPIHLENFFSITPDWSCGALASFVGIVRNHDHGRPVRKLFYDSYASMADSMIGRLAREAGNRWNIHEIRVLHRIGEIRVGEAAVAIAVSSSHREEAFTACRFMIEEIKNRVPIWKKEFYEDGVSAWVLGCRS